MEGGRKVGRERGREGVREKKRVEKEGNKERESECDFSEYIWYYSQFGYEFLVIIEMIKIGILSLPFQL